MQIGWAEADITPPGPVMLAGQFHARLSKGVESALKSTVWIASSDSTHVIFVACDLLAISDRLRDRVRRCVHKDAPMLDPFAIILHATHTHCAPVTDEYARDAAYLSGGSSQLLLDAMSVEDYVIFAAQRITDAIVRAWQGRYAGHIAYGMGHCYLGRKRRWVDIDGRATMYGLHPQLYESFRHAEGCEDHAVQVIATYDQNRVLQGIVINVACPAQVSEHGYEVSADYWHEVRQYVRDRLGEHVFVLAQCSAAGDVSPHALYDTEAYKRMLQLQGWSEREQLARRLVAAVEEIIIATRESAQSMCVLSHEKVDVRLPMRHLQRSDYAEAIQEYTRWKQAAEAKWSQAQEELQLSQPQRWYRQFTDCYGRMHWYEGVLDRWALQQAGIAHIDAELHVVQIGDVAIVTNPYELYVDFGIQMKVRSPAMQTFVVQLAGEGTYVPSARSVRGGGYGSVPASNMVGAEGGQQLTEQTVERLQAIWSTGCYAKKHRA
jgi:hypothetical protein